MRALDVLAALLEPVQVHFSWRPLLADPTDDMVLETAINGQAQAIVTFNKRDDGEVPGRFGIDVLRPIEVLGG
ncbi:MAG: PIN domain-containing protein [Geminicoccaceae bacterium]